MIEPGVMAAGSAVAMPDRGALACRASAGCAPVRAATAASLRQPRPLARVDKPAVADPPCHVHKGDGLALRAKPIDPGPGEG